MTSPKPSLALVGVRVEVVEVDAVGVWLGDGRVRVASTERSTDMGDSEGGSDRGGELRGEWARGVARSPEAKMEEYAPR